MSSFTEATVVEIAPARGRRQFVVVGGFTFDVGYKGSGWQIRIPDGFVTDLASDPTGILDLTGASLYAVKSFIVHDWLRENTLFTKISSDAIFLMAMEAEGVPALWRELIFSAVRMNNSRTRHNPDAAVFGGVEMPPY